MSHKRLESKVTLYLRIGSLLPSMQWIEEADTWFGVGRAQAGVETGPLLHWDVGVG